MPGFNSDGNLPPGMNQWSLSEVDHRLVREFVGSLTRPAIAKGYSVLVAAIGNHGLDVEQWLDGSFCTTKVDPGDLDLVTILDEETVEALPQQAQVALELLFGGPKTKETLLCDSYVAIRVPASHPAYDIWQASREYWLRWFGQDRLGRTKGLVRVMAGLNYVYPDESGSSDGH